MTAISGLHHVTAFAGAVAPNADFYTRVLGLRLVKTTVNFDDPGTYHLYYGDGAGHPGTIITFFPIAAAAPGRVGAGETAETAFRVPRAALPFWAKHLAAHEVASAPVTDAFGEPVLRFGDPDGMALALVGVDGDDGDPWAGGPVPAEHAIRGFHGVTLNVGAPDSTGAILTDVLGLAEAARDGANVRFEGSAAIGGLVTLRATPELARGRQGRGSVHHIAFRAADDAVQAAMADRLRANHRVATTEQRDRNYFRSIYFREPSGVLFEIATDQPGFAVDEAPDHLGEALKLPPALEAHRATIEATLPPLPRATAKALT